MELRERFRQARDITIVGALINIVLAAAKIVFGLWGHSQALVADGFHSLSDLLSDGLVLVAAHYGSRAADTDHPYGHGRIETAATLFLSLIIIITGLGIAADSIYDLIHLEKEKPHYYVLCIAFFSLVLKEILYHYTLSYGRRINSELLMANAWHHRSDSASSAVVLLGVIGALFGYFYLDAMAALIVALLIAHMGINLGWSSVRELVDTGVDDETLTKIRHIILQIPGVCMLHQLRTRSMGGKILLDVHVLVSPKISVSEGHHIGQRVHYELMQQLGKISDVTVHVDPEDDEVATPCIDLPNREIILPLVMHRLETVSEIKFPNNNDIVLHYLDGKIYFEIYLPLILTEENSPEKISEKIHEALAGLHEIGEISIFYR